MRGRYAEVDVLRFMRRWHGLVALAMVLGFAGAAFAGATHGGAPTPAEQARTEKVMARFAAAHWIAEGTGKRILYVFMDPNCPYCHKLFDELQPQIASRHLQVRYIVVGYLTATSQGKAAAILTAKDPLKALEYNERNFGRHGDLGGIDEILPSARIIGELEKNYRLLRATGANGVPAMVVVDRDRGPTLIPGAPSPKDLRKILDNLR